MNRLVGKTWLTVAAVAIAAAMTQVAGAQPGEGRGGRGFGRGGFGGFLISSVRLATADEVQSALNLSDEQKEKVAAINEQLGKDIRALFQQGASGREQMQKLNQDASAKLAEVLDETQQKRLMGISIQVHGAAALSEPAVAKELNITDDQKTKLVEVRDEIRQALRDARDELEGLSREEARAKFGEMRAEADKKLLAALTTEQQAQLEALKGEPVEIDMSQFRGRVFGGGGRGDGQRGGRRGDAGGAADSSE